MSLEEIISAVLERPPIWDSKNINHKNRRIKYNKLWEEIKNELNVDGGTMSLPQYYSTSVEYLKECTEFLEQYQFLYNFANTDILVLNVLDQININHTTLKDLPIFEDDFELSSNDNKDRFLSDFFTGIRKFKVTLDEFEDKSLEKKFHCPLSLKKKHEIMYLARQIKKIALSTNCDTVIDFGSGLGYLDQVLYETTKFNVLGLECNDFFYVEAKKRQKKYHINSLARIKYKKHTVTENSITTIAEYINDKFPNQSGFCLTGLHACADLTVTAINIFLQMANAQSMVIVPCCYHKMTGSDNCFKNFPLSESYKTIAGEENHRQFMRIPLLRLAAQPPCLSEKLENRVFNLLSRAVLQLYAHKNNLTLKRNKRKAVRLKTMENDFEKYIQVALTGFNIVNELVEDTNCETTINLDEIRKIWQELPESTIKKVAIFILIQDELQPVVENLILHDRLLYLRENGIDNCRYEKIFNHNVSPRCLALIANK